MLHTSQSGVPGACKQTVARLAEVEFDALNHTVVLETAVNTLADILSKRQ